MAEDKDKQWTVVPDSDVPDRRPGSVSLSVIDICFVGTSIRNYAKSVYYKTIQVMHYNRCLYQNEEDSPTHVFIDCVFVLFQCIQGSQQMTDEEFMFVNNHQLMDTHVQHELVNNLPHFYKMGVVYEKFVIDTSTYYTVYFIATSKYK